MSSDGAGKMLEVKWKQASQLGWGVWWRGMALMSFYMYFIDPFLEYILRETGLFFVFRVVALFLVVPAASTFLASYLVLKYGLWGGHKVVLINNTKKNKNQKTI